MTRNKLGRRQLLKAAAGAAGIIAGSGCDNLSRSEWVRRLLGHTEALTERVQRALTPATALAKEYEERDISAVFPPNGNTHPGTSDYVAKAERDFADWQIVVTGLIAKPATWSLAELRAMPSRTQIIRHDCVEGWSAVGNGRACLWEISCIRSNRCRRPNTSCSTAPTSTMKAFPTMKASPCRMPITPRRFWRMI
ncbi:MAG: molybdopterin-dependent oxidoreductase [Nitrospira sp.]|jgi:DMSO/TMAO reductase YedYZ molybdopterin-dependent catalytic subunit|nr:molybdopterin-dependent oxidoreductase [Nitrospira sp.]